MSGFVARMQLALVLVLLACSQSPAHDSWISRGGLRNAAGMTVQPESGDLYFEDNGIGVVAMEGMGVEFKSIPDVPAATIASFIKKAFAEHEGADAVYILGSALEALPLIAPLERDLGVPVVQAIAARIWEIQKRLKVHEPIKGYGRLLETLPA